VRVDSMPLFPDQIAALLPDAVTAR
jgi:hypothetical protein